jgi:hypothetical protein
MMFPKNMPPSIGGIPWLGKAIEFGSRPIELFLENKKKVILFSKRILKIFFLPFNPYLWRKYGNAFR